MHGSGIHRYYPLYAVMVLAKMEPPQVQDYMDGVVEVTNAMNI